MDRHPSIKTECCKGAEVSGKRGNHDALMCHCGTYNHDELTCNLAYAQNFLERSVDVSEVFYAADDKSEYSLIFNS